MDASPLILRGLGDGVVAGSDVSTVVRMCRRITCGTCDKPSYTGCGAHIEQVLGDVAVDDRCTCTDAEKTVKRGGWLGRLLGRS